MRTMMADLTDLVQNSLASMPIAFCTKTKEEEAGRHAGRDAGLCRTMQVHVSCVRVRVNVRVSVCACTRVRLCAYVWRPRVHVVEWCCH